MGQKSSQDALVSSDDDADLDMAGDAFLHVVFDVGQINSLACKLDLGISSAKVFDVAITRVLCEIACAVEAAQ